MDHIAFMEIVDGVEHLLDRLRSIFLCELSIFTDPVKQFSTRG